MKIRSLWAIAFALSMTWALNAGASSAFKVAVIEVLKSGQAEPMAKRNISIAYVEGSVAQPNQIWIRGKTDQEGLGDLQCVSTPTLFDLKLDHDYVFALSLDGKTLRPTDHHIAMYSMEGETRKAHYNCLADLVVSENSLANNINISCIEN